MGTKKQYKDLNYYLNLPWTYTVELSTDENNKKIYIVRVNELPGICTDAALLDEAMELIKEPMLAAFEFFIENNEEIPEPVGNNENISYKTTRERLRLIRKEAKKKELSISQVIDGLVDSAFSGEYGDFRK